MVLKDQERTYSILYTLLVFLGTQKSGLLEGNSTIRFLATTFNRLLFGTYNAPDAFTGHTSMILCPAVFYNSEKLAYMAACMA